MFMKGSNSYRVFEEYLNGDFGATKDAFVSSALEFYGYARSRPLKLIDKKFSFELIYL